MVGEAVSIFLLKKFSPKPGKIIMAALLVFVGI